MVAFDLAARQRQHHNDAIHEYLIEEDAMGDSDAQTRLLGYLVDVLEALLGVDGSYVGRNLTMYHPAIQNSQNMISPDIAIFLGIPLSPEERRHLSSWDMRPPHPPRSRARQDHLHSVEAEQGPEQQAIPARPCPPVMIEVSSPSTWKTDIHPGLADKVVLYGKMGVQVYLAYDPNDPPVWQGIAGRLLGWRYDTQGEPHLLEPNERGWLWCAELDSWAGADDYRLRFYDPVGNRRMTGAEQSEAARRAAEEQVRAEQAAREQAEAAQRAEQAAREQAEAAQRAEQAAREQAEERTERLLRLLREQGIDPGDL